LETRSTGIEIISDVINIGRKEGSKRGVIGIGFGGGVWEMKGAQ
jgi:hypothetical protein